MNACMPTHKALHMPACLPVPLTAVPAKARLLRLHIHSLALAQLHQGMQAKQLLRCFRPASSRARQCQPQQQCELGFHHEQQRLAAGRELLGIRGGGGN